MKKRCNTAPASGISNWPKYIALDIRVRQQRPTEAAVFVAKKSGGGSTFVSIPIFKPVRNSGSGTRKPCNAGRLREAEGYRPYWLRYKIGQSPVPMRQETEIIVTTLGRLETVEQFGELVVRTGADGEILKLKDIARIELGALTSTFIRKNRLGHFDRAFGV